MTPLPIERWHEMVRAKDLSGLEALLSDAVVFHSPVVHTPQVGRVITQKYLTAAFSVLNNGSFEYVGQWYGQTSAVLEFRCKCDGILINGVDIIEWDVDGRICTFKVMIRPLKAINTLHAMMAKQLQAAP